MIVVVIVGVLSTLAVYGVMGYLRAAKMSEAPEMLHAIKAAQESYKDEIFLTSPSAPISISLYPTKKGELGAQKKQGLEADGRGSSTTSRRSASRRVRRSTSATRIAAMVVESTSGKVTDVAANLNYLASPAGSWYIAKAMADVDGDGTYSVFVASSFTDEINSRVEE